MKQLQCDYCKKYFTPQRHTIRRRRINRTKNSFCSHQCVQSFRIQQGQGSTTLPCGWCGKTATRTNSEHKKSKSGKMFCCASCAASYNNTLKRKSRRSKCEKLLESFIRNEFPNLLIEPSNKTLLNGLEVDIYLPSIKLAIEWNGIVHFKPIYGQEKLSKIQKLDAEKQRRASENGISFIVIPDLVSTEKRVKEAFVSISKIIRQMLQK